MLQILSPGVKNILLAGIFFGAINALVKYLSHIPAVQILFFRSIVSLILSGFYLYNKKITIFSKSNFKFLFLRGFAGAMALILYFTTIQRIPLASAVTILYLAPIFTVIMAIFINREYPNKLQWPFMLVSFAGAVLLKGSDPRIGLIDLAMGIAAAIFAGLAYNFIRKLKNKADPHLVIFYFPMVTLPIVIPFLFNSWKWPTITEYIALLAIGVLTQIAQYFMTHAYMFEKASSIGHFNYLTSVYAWLSGVIFFGEQIPTISVLAIGLIIAGVILCTKLAK